MQQHDVKDQTPAEIAAGLDRDRADLALAIDGLRDRFSVDALLGDAVDVAKTNLAPYGRALDTAVRSNPAAAVMAGVGLAWLIFGRKGGGLAGEAASSLAGTSIEAVSRWEDEGGNPAPRPEIEEAWIDEADSLRARASEMLSRIDAAARDRLQPVAEIARQRAEVLTGLAMDTRRVMRRGLEGLAVDAQDRILAVREKAYAARGAAIRQGTRLIEDRPVLAGAIGMAIGAAMAAVLPRTATEDRLFGRDRDRLLAQAQAALRAETVRATRVASRLADTVTAEVRDHARELATDRL